MLFGEEASSVAIEQRSELDANVLNAKSELEKHFHYYLGDDQPQQQFKFNING